MHKPYQHGEAVRLRGLAPLADARTRVVVLGSFPSEASLAKQQYYGHPRNHFWFLMSCVLNEPLVQWPYALRCERLLARGIGIWDTVGACAREGSLDSAIEGAQVNDPQDLLAIAPQLARACFNGGFSQSLMDAWAAHGLQTRALPSSSPANATHHFDVKLAAWKAALAEI
ncbi:MAG: DNA-deoxyinosine glycosylase [Burkholderiaceae bacterium]